MHPGAVVSEDRLRHEGGGLASFPGGVLDEILELHHVVGGFQHGVESPVDLGLTCGAAFVVGALDHQACVLHVADDVVTQVAEVVNRGHGEVATLVLDLVAPVATVLHATGVPGPRLGVDVVVGGVGGGVEADVVEDVELGLGGEEGGFRDARGD